MLWLFAGAYMKRAVHHAGGGGADGIRVAIWYFMQLL